MKRETGQFFSGTSNIVLPPGGKAAFPQKFQDKSRLCYYSSLFNSLEVNSSFYKIPMERTVRRWAEETNEGFRFTFKLFKEITHNKFRIIDETLVEKFMQAISGAGNKMGCLLIQFPPSIVYNKVYLKRLLDVIKLHDLINRSSISVEFRHPSWYREDTYELLAAYNATMVIQDMPKSATPIVEPWTDFIFLRFHGPAGDYRSSYEDDVLLDYAQLIQEWMSEGKTVYAYFNNTMGDAFQNLITLNDFVKGASL